jgi:hypothetical protein
MVLLLFSLLFSLFTITLADGFSLSPNPEPHLRNAFHIFNAIHSSMRQWGSSLNHNGVSFFPVLVPKGTEFYHGRGDNKTVTGMEWLAFEPEHALLFARPRFRRPPPKDENRPPFQFGHQIPFETASPEEPSEPEAGFLHTYATKKDLQLIYVDGMSAGKTSNGTLDSQDYVILNSTEEHFGFWDYERAQEMCDIARTDWEGRVDGFLRMEAGFEIILCDFAANLNVRRIARAGGRTEEGPDLSFSSNFAYLRAVSDRYHGIGGNRVRINYDNFVTAYTYDIDLFSTSSRAPRLQNVPANTLSAIRSELDSLVLSEPNPFTQESTDWQAIVDMIVTHYSARLQYLASPQILSNYKSFQYELNLLLSPFIDYQNRSQDAEVERCAIHFLPSATTANASVASQITSYTSHHICFWLFFLAANPKHSPARIMDLLIKTLNWTTWKECRGCGWDEVCLVPLWPYGSEEDWIKPSCTNATTLTSKNGYWGHRGPGGGRKRPGKGKGPKPPEHGEV